MISDLLLESALRSVVLSLVVGVALRIARVRHPRLEMTAWMLVLAGALLMPFLMRWRVIEIQPPRRVVANAPAVLRAVNRSIPLQALPSRPTAVRTDWLAISFAVYYAAVGVMLVRLLTGLSLTLGVWRRSRRIREPWSAGLDIRETPAIGAPATFGSSILLPAGWRTWDAAKLRAVIAHERAHVEWGDFYIQLLARLHLTVFLFSPLAWWLRSRLSVLAEAASDDAALETVADPPFYAEILLGLARQPQPALTAVCMARLATLSRRVERILAGAAVSAKVGWKRYALVGSAVPGMALLIAGCSVHGQPIARFAPVQNPGPASAPAKSATPSPSSARQGGTWSWQSGKHGDAWVIVSGDSWNMSGSAGDAEHARSFRGTIPGDYIWFQREGKEYLITDPPTVRRVKELFGREEELGRKQGELGEEQGRLGEEQARLGALQAGASARMPSFDERMNEVRAEMMGVEKQLANTKLGALAASNKLLNDLDNELRAAKDKELTQEGIGELQEKAGELQERLSEDLDSRLSEVRTKLDEMQTQFGEMQTRIGQEQSRLGKEQSRLGAEQSRLGEQQSKLGEEQSRIAEKATRELRRIVEECLRNGQAQPVQ